MQLDLGIPKYTKPSDSVLALVLPLLLALAVSVLSADAIWAQGETTSAVVGSVSDPDGKAAVERLMGRP